MSTEVRENATVEPAMLVAVICIIKNLPTWLISGVYSSATAPVIGEQSAGFSVGARVTSVSQISHW